jgi:hypothetical protein
MAFVVSLSRMSKSYARDISLQQTSREWLAKSLIHRGKMAIPNCREAEIMGMAIRN